MKYYVRFPSRYADTKDGETDEMVRTSALTEMRNAARMLVTSDLITTKSGFSVGVGLYGLVIDTDRMSTFKACKRMLKHWGFIS